MPINSLLRSILRAPIKLLTKYMCVNNKVQKIVRKYNASIMLIWRIEERIHNNRFSANLEKADLFFLGLGDGPGKDHKHIIDGTYKLIQNRSLLTSPII